MRMLLRDLISAATRLSVVGPLEGSRLQVHYAGDYLCTVCILGIFSVIATQGSVSMYVCMSIISKTIIHT